MKYLELYFIVPIVLIELYYWFYWYPRNYKETREYKFDKLCSDIEESL